MVLVAGLAIVTEVAVGLLERLARSPGLGSARTQLVQETAPPAPLRGA